MQVADALYTKGQLRQSLGNAAGAKAAFRASLEIHRQLSPMPLTFLDPMADLSEILKGEGKIGEAEELLHEGQRFAEKSIGELIPLMERSSGGWPWSIL